LDDKVDAMAALERQARAPAGFVAASTGPEGGDRKAPAEVANPDAIDVDLDDL
jgi:pre-mRNA-splicing factor SYF1